MKTIIPLFFSVYNPKNIEIYRFPLHLATKKHQQSRYLLHFAQKFISIATLSYILCLSPFFMSNVPIYSRQQQLRIRNVYSISYC